ncbi:MAG: histidine triad nucleotide-binding protein [Verrucomicrobiota bacterium]
MSEKTLFQKIIQGEIPGDFLYEDDECVVLRDIDPQAPTHLLVIPRQVIPRVGEASEADQALLGHLLLVAGKMGREMELADGFRVVINHGKHGGESVPHLHVHLLGGRQMSWPPG